MHYLETNDLSKLFRVIHTKNRVHHLAALTAFWTGARVSQVLELQGQDIFESNGKIVIKIHAAKRGFERLHTLHIDADPAFDMSPLIELARTRPTSRLFGGATREYLNKCLKRYCAEAGIHTDFGHMHCMRHSIAHQIWNQTKNLGAISHFLGHRSETAALCYLKENNGKIGQSAVDSLQLA